VINQITTLYNQFLTIFPLVVQPIISFVIFVSLVMGIIRLVKQNFIWLILLIVFIPASVPILKNIFDGVLAFLQNLI